MLGTRSWNSHILGGAGWILVTLLIALPASGQASEPRIPCQPDSHEHHSDRQLLFPASNSTIQSPFAIGVADLNGDEVEDFVVGPKGWCGDPQARIEIYLNDGHGTFSNATDSVISGAVPTMAMVRQFFFEDFNVDGQVDIFLSTHGYECGPQPWPGEQDRLLLSDGAGKWIDATENLPAFQDFSHGSTVADIDGDGDPDIFVNNLGGETVEANVSFRLLVNDGSGKFAQENERLSHVCSDPLCQETRWFWAQFIDANGDGAPDLYLGNNGDFSRNQMIVLNDGTGHFSNPVPNALPPPYFSEDSVPQGTEVLDVNKDGLDDLFVSDTPDGSAPKIMHRLFVSNGDGTFRDETAERLPDQDLEGHIGDLQVTLRDVNSDGLKDVVSFVDVGIEQIQLDDGTGVYRSLPDDFLCIDNDFFGLPIDKDGDGGFDYLFHKILRDLGLSQTDDRVWFYLIESIADYGPKIIGNGGRNKLIGGVGRNQLYGRAGSDRLFGGDDDDALVGGRGNDQLWGERGSDSIDGGPGNDSAMYREKSAAFHISEHGESVTVTDLVSGSVDSLVGVEKISFADRSIALQSHFGLLASGEQTVRLLFQDNDGSRAQLLTLDPVSKSELLNRPIGSSNFTIRSLVRMNDVSDDGRSEVAVFLHNDTTHRTRAYLMDGVTGDRISSFAIEPKYRVLKALAGLSPDSGSAFLGVLAKNNAGRHALLVHRASDGSRVSRTFLPNGFEPVQAHALGGVMPALKGKWGVLGINSNGRSIVQIRDSVTGEIAQKLDLGAAYYPVDFAVLDDVISDGSAEIAFLGVSKTDDSIRVIVKDIGTSKTVQRFSLSSRFRPLELVHVKQPGTAGSLGILGVKDNGVVRLQLRDIKSATVLANIRFEQNNKPRSLVLLDDINGNNTNEVGLLSFDDTGQGLLEIKDTSTGADIWRVAVQ